MNPCSPPSVSMCLYQAACSLPASPPPSLLPPTTSPALSFFSLFFFYQTNVITCVNPASASLVDGINKCKNHKSLCSCLCMHVYRSEKQSVYTCLRACTWLACVIGVKSISPVVAWKMLSKLQHIYLKNDSAALHGMLLILLMALLSSRMCFGRWNRLQTDAFMPPLDTEGYVSVLWRLQLQIKESREARPSSRN